MGVDKFISVALVCLAVVVSGNLDEGGGRNIVRRKAGEDDVTTRKSDENSLLLLPPSLGVPKCCGRGHALEVTTREDWKCITTESLIPDASESTRVPLVFLNNSLNLESGWRCGDRKSVGRWTEKLLLNKEDEGGIPEFVIDRFGDEEDSKDGEESPLQLYHLFEDGLHEDFCWDEVVTKSGEKKIEAALICVEEQEGVKKETSCQDRPCVRTCCLPGHTFEEEEGKCIADFLSDEEDSRPQVDEGERGYDVLSGFPPDCSALPEEGEVLAKFESSKMQIDAVTGELVVDKDTRVGTSKFCVDKNKIYACVKTNSNNNKTSVILDRVVLALAAASVPFLTAALVVVYRKKTANNNSSGNSGDGFVVLATIMIGMLLPFFVLYVILLVVNPVHLSGLCVAGGLTMQFLYLSSLAWLNCMCFVVWSSLKSISLVSKLLPTRRATCYPCGISPSLLLHSLWGFGCPLIAVSVTSVVQFGTSTSSAHHPGIGVDHCFLSAPLYLHLIAGPLLLTNLFFFLDTARNLCCGLWRPLTRSNSDNLNHSGMGERGQRSAVVFRMFFAMGIPWTGEVISWILKGVFGITSWTLLISGLFNIINASQGIFIFAVLFFDSKTLNETRRVLRHLFSSKNVHNGDISVNYHNESTHGQQDQQRSKSLPSSPVTIFKEEEGEDKKREEGTKCQKIALESTATTVLEENGRRNA